MTATPVTVISAYYNRQDYVDRSVASLLAQTYPALEIIITNDGSRDATGAALDRFAGDPRLRIIHQENAGLVATMNRMIAEAKGEYIAVHGSGDISLPERLAKQAALLDSDPSIGIVGCWRQLNGKVNGPQYADPATATPLLPLLYQRNPFSHGEVMYRKSLFNQVGGYRPLFSVAQDRDLWLRFARHAHYAIVPEVLYERTEIADSVTGNAEKIWQQRKLSAFAIHCAQNLDGQGRDLIDRYGTAALLYVPPSSKVARELARLGLSRLARGNHSGGRFLLDKAVAERVSPITLAAWLAGRVVPAGLLRKLSGRA
jgi:glycosyltransferase involved in cell wall biosynthesis